MAKQLILDANILMRAVLGTRVATLIRDHAAGVDLLTVDEAFEDVATYLPLGLLARERLKGRDEDDWPYVALALVLDAQSGQKIRISLAVALLLGQQIALSFT